jgi:hypothetical protein
LDALSAAIAALDKLMAEVAERTTIIVLLMSYQVFIIDMSKSKRLKPYSVSVGINNIKADWRISDNGN